MKEVIKHFLQRVRNKYFFCFGDNRFIKSGTTNSIIFGENNRFKHCKVVVHWNNNKVVFGKLCNMSGLHILIEGENNLIEFGDRVKVNASSIQPTVINALGGTKIIIGKGSLFSNNIEIHSSDYHRIYDKEGKLINPDRDITIGEYVWVGLGCKILKGSVIANGVVVGAGSLVSGHYEEENVIIAGNPAKIIKKQVFWEGVGEDNCASPEL